ncbi:MAG: peptide chain release factor N(5)-glutamine methyltransferase [Limisphaerales bacterium]
MTVLEVIQRSTEFLQRHGVDSPRLQIELLLAHILKLPRLQLYLNHERALAETELAALRALEPRRAKREPLQHLVGSAAFLGLDLAVSPDALIPRPETEPLVELTAAALAKITTPAVLDFGTGTGCIALALATTCPSASIHALDISAPALALARRNADVLKLSDRVAFHLGDGFTALPPELRFDLIVSNPPYIPAAEIATLQPEVRDFDPRLALDGGADGLDFYRRLAAESPAWLRAGGGLFAEFGDGQGDAVKSLFLTHGWTRVALHADLTQRLRVLEAWRTA